MVPVDSSRVSRALPYSGNGFRVWINFCLRVCHPLWIFFPEDSAIDQIGTYRRRPYNPRTTQIVRVWAVPISLATTFGIEVSFPPGGTEMVHFSVRLFQPMNLLIPRVLPGWVSPFGNSGSTPVCGSWKLSQFATFHARFRQGIHRAPLVARDRRIYSHAAE